MKDLKGIYYYLAKKPIGKKHINSFKQKVNLDIDMKMKRKKEKDR